MIFIFPTEMEGRKFRLKHPDAEVLICGVGMVETAVTLSSSLEKIGSKRVVLAGIAGAYDIEIFPVGTVVEVVEEVVEELPKKYQKSYPTAQRYGIKTAVSNCVNRPFFSVETAADIENMEGAAAAAICRTHGIEFSQIRAISNRVGDPFERWDIELATDELTDILSDIYTNKKQEK